MAESKSSKKKKQKELLSEANAQKRNRIFALIILLLCVGIYFNTHFNEYNFDDNYVIENNEKITNGFQSVIDIFSSPYGTNKNDDRYGYRPIARISYIIDYELWEAAPGHDRTGKNGYSHLFNVLLYIINIFILFALLKRILRNYNPYLPFIITLLYLAHPLFTEVVASLKNRDIILSSIFGLLATRQIIRWADLNRSKYLIFGVIFYILAILSKETAFAFVFIFPLALYFFTDIKMKKLWYFFGVSGILTLLVVLGPSMLIPDMGRTYRFEENPLVEENIFTRFTTGMYVMLLYLKKLIFPYPLLYYYGYNTIPVKGLLDGWVIFSILIYLALFAYAIYKIREKNIFSFLILFFLITAGMYSNIASPVPGIMAERFLYIPGIAFVMFVGLMIFKIFGLDPKKPFIKFSQSYKVLLLTFVLLIPMSVYTYNRNKVWRTKYSLYSHDIKYLENSVKANDMLATELVRQLNNIFNSEDPSRIPPPVNSQRRPIEEALKHYKKVIEIYPKHYNAWNNIGTIHFKILKKPDLAIPFYEKTIELRPDFPNPYVNLAEVYSRMGKTDTAVSLYSKVYSLDSSRVSPLSRIANIYAEAGELEKARKVNRRIMELHPDSYLPYLNLGFYAARQGDTTNAQQFFEGAIDKGFEGNVYSIMAKIYLDNGNRLKAIEYDKMARDYERQRRMQQK